MKGQENKRLKRVNECFLGFTSDPDRNMQLLTECCGELMGATCALYNRLENGMLHALARWRAPEDFNPLDQADGHICHDVIKAGGQEVFVLQNLDQTGYAKTDPNVSAYCLKTYIGAPVNCKDRCVGSLCVVYQNNYSPDDEEKKLLQILAASMGVEEERRGELAQLRAMKRELEERVAERTADLAKANERLRADIVERKRVEGALTKSEAKLRKIFEAIPDLLAVIDRDHRLVHCNWHGGYEYVDERIRGESPHCYDAFYPGGDGPCTPCHASEVFKTGKPLMTEKYNPSIGTVEIRAYPLFSDSGEVELVVEHIRDITERKRMEEALRASEELLKAIIDGSPLPILVIDADHVVVNWNKAMEICSGVSAGEMIGTSRHWTPFYGEYRECLADLLASENEEAIPRFYGEKCRKSGKIEGAYECVDFFPMLGEGGKWLYFTAKAIRDGNGMIVGAVEIFEDITEMKRIEEALMAAQEELIRNEKLAAIGRLAGSVGHELRNPLGVMNNAVYFLKMVLSDADDAVGEYLDIIRQEIGNSQRIIGDLLDFSRTRPPEVRTVTAGELIEKCLDSCEIPAGIRIVADLPDTLPLLTIDPRQMEQVFQNLIDNAVQAMPDGGSLTISARSSDNGGPSSRGAGGFIMFSVEDTGEGIAPENMNKLFQPLFTTKPRGIGLGLVVCRNLTEANGGSIEAESEPGKGTRFTITLPTEEGTWASR